MLLPGRLRRRWRAHAIDGRAGGLEVGVGQTRAATLPTATPAAAPQVGQTRQGQAHKDGDDARNDDNDLCDRTTTTTTLMITLIMPIMPIFLHD